MRQKSSEKEIKNLLELAEADLTPEKQPIDGDVEKFIRAVNITAGQDLIPAFVIYYVYCLWRPHSRVSKPTFFRRFHTIFKKKLKNNMVHYFLDNSNELFDTSSDGRIEAQQFAERSRKQLKDAKKAKKTRKQKKQDKACLSSS